MNISEILIDLYGDETAIKYCQQIHDKIATFKHKNCLQIGHELDQGDVVLISYGDVISSKHPLKILKNFLLEYADDIISTVHILPFFPYSSDYGFSVIDYSKVNPQLGNWEDIEEIGEDFHLAFDAVFNHISKESYWFKQFLEGEEKYTDWFIEAGEDFDSSHVVRPRALPLFHNYEDSARGTHRIWTTFSEDQIDLNFKSPELLMELIDILLFYIEKGARIIRLDAIAFCWKESGSNCLHLPQAHLIVKLFRQIAEKVAPGTIILTETNVPHEENISYFGNQDEAHMVYQFPLPPLSAQAILRQDARALSTWAASLEEPPPECTFLNFLASHDGIGVRPLLGLVPDSELSFLADECLRKGGKVGYKNNPDGSQSPYELNINYYSLLREPDEDLELSVKKFILSQAIMLTMPGVPGIYFHSLFGSENWFEGIPKNSERRTINRERVSTDTLRNELNTPGSRRQLIYQQYHKLLKIRKKHEAFHPKSGFKILKIRHEIFAIIRGTEQIKIILALFNVSSQTINLSLNNPLIPKQLNSIRDDEIIDSSQITLEAFDFDLLTFTA